MGLASIDSAESLCWRKHGNRMVEQGTHTKIEEENNSLWWYWHDDLPFGTLGKKDMDTSSVMNLLKAEEVACGAHEEFKILYCAPNEVEPSSNFSFIARQRGGREGWNKMVTGIHVPPDHIGIHVSTDMWPQTLRFFCQR